MKNISSIMGESNEKFGPFGVTTFKGTFENKHFQSFLRHAIEQAFKETRIEEGDYKASLKNKNLLGVAFTDGWNQAKKKQEANQRAFLKEEE